MSFHFQEKIPLYYQIKEDLQQKIEKGDYKAGSQLPPELELANYYGVSRPTIRQAIMELVQLGLLERGRGKGTFVSKPPIWDNALSFSTFQDPLPDATEVATSLREVRKINASKGIAGDLNLQEKDEVYELVFYMHRQGEALILRRFHIPASLVPQLPCDPSDEHSVYHRSIHRILQEDYQLQFSYALQHFQAAAATKEEADILQINAGEPVMIWQGTLFTAGQVPFARVKTVFRGNRFRFVIAQGEIKSNVIMS